MDETKGERVIGNGKDQDVFTLVPPMQESNEPRATRHVVRRYLLRRPDFPLRL